MKEKKSKQTEAVEATEASDTDDGSGDDADDVDDDVDDVDDIDAEIAELERSLAVLTARGARVREMIVEQTRLLLGEESLLSRARGEKVREEVKQNRKVTTTTPPPQSSLSAQQEEFLQDLLGLENILAALRKTDRAVARELRKRKKRPRDKAELEEEKTSDSILDHPTQLGVEDPRVVNLEADYDVPTIIVEEEDPGDQVQVVLEYEDDVPLLVPQPLQPPRQAPALHGHFLYHQPPPVVPHYIRHYPPPRPRYPGHYSRYQDHQYYPQQYEGHYQGVPHITLTGSLLRGFDNLGRGFHK